MEVKTDMARHTKCFITLSLSLSSDGHWKLKEIFPQHSGYHRFLIQSRQRYKCHYKAREVLRNTKKMNLLSWFKRQCLVLELSLCEIDY